MDTNGDDNIDTTQSLLVVLPCFSYEREYGLKAAVVTPGRMCDRYACAYSDARSPPGLSQIGAGCIRTLADWPN